LLLIAFNCLQDPGFSRKKKLCLATSRVQDLNRGNELFGLSTLKLASKEEGRNYGDVIVAGLKAVPIKDTIFTLNILNVVALKLLISDGSQHNSINLNSH